MVQSPLPVIPAAGSDIFSLKGKYYEGVSWTEISS